MDTKLKLILLLAMFLVSPASAKFICGEIISTDEISPAWYEVKTYPITNENYFSICQVSPSNNKYCCDLDLIKDKTGYQWKTFDIFETKITDTSSGYFASPKNLTLTGEGYDTSSILFLQKAITITSPNSTLTISKTPIPIQTNISNACINSTIPKTNLSFGKNNITIATTCNDEQFTLNKTLFIIQNITFQKTYTQFSNSKNKQKIKSTKTGTINLQANLSHPIENIPLKEYVPTLWEISNVSDNGIVEFSTPQYNVITWQVIGDNFNFSYKIKAPEIRLIPQDYIFKTQIDQYNLDETTVQVYRFIPLPFEQKTYKGEYTYIPEQLSKVSQGLPLIFKEQGVTAALYSTIPLQQGSFNLLNFLYKGKIDRQFDYLKSYQIQTTLNSTEQGKLILEYKTNKTFLKENNYKEIIFFEKYKENFSKITSTVTTSNDDTLKYRFESKKLPYEIFILAEKNSINTWDKILIFWDRVIFADNSHPTE